MEIIVNKEKIKYFIGCNVPVFACNFRCQYCYLGHHPHPYKKGIKPFIRNAEYIAEYFSVKNMGGTCYFNFCAFGETLMHPELVDLVFALTKQGHYADIITNGTLSAKFDKLIDTLDSFSKNHLFIKFSFHYLELLKHNLLDVFCENVEKVKQAGISFSVEITPHDELIPYIDELKRFSLDKFGALPHVTVARNEGTADIEILSALNKDDYRKTWSSFDSELFEFKLEIFNKRRDEFCYAGLWSLQVDLYTGNYSQCYKGDVLGNITQKGRPVNFRAIGKCRQPHCFNGHAFLAYGLIPELETPDYRILRDRTMIDGEHWLQNGAQDFFSTKLIDSNKSYTLCQKKKCLRKNKFYLLQNYLLRGKFKLKNRLWGL